MALQPCFECGASVSTLAPTCPRCGAPDPARIAEPPTPPPPAEAPSVSTTHPAVWYYLADDRRHGPHTREEMAEMLQRGAISYGTRVRDDSMQFWMPLRAAPALSAEQAAAPLPPPVPRHPPSRLPRSDDERRVQSARTVAMVVYALQAASFVVCLTLPAGVIVNYVQREGVRRTWVDSHFAWQIATFWGLVWWWLGALALGLLFDFSSTVFVVAYLPSVPWLLYRIVRGWLRLSDGERVD